MFRDWPIIYKIKQIILIDIDGNIFVAFVKQHLTGIVDFIVYRCGREKGPYILIF